MKPTKRSSGRSSNKGNAAILFRRYIWLVDLIYRRGRISFEEINRCWQRSPDNDSGEELPLKTFHNHRNAIQDMFQIDIACDRRAGYLYYIENAEDMEQGGVRQWLVNTFAVNNLINESHRLKRRILFEEIPSGQRFLTQIIEAMRDELMLEITHQGFWANEPHTFEVEPLCVKVFRLRWYLVARSTYDGKIRVYALDRIHEMLTTDNRFEMPADFDPQGYFHDAFGVIVDEDLKIETVRLKVDVNQSKFMRSLPLHHSQREVETTDKYSIFELRLRPTVDFIQELLSQCYPNESVEVLEPEWLAEEMHETGCGISLINWPIST